MESTNPYDLSDFVEVSAVLEDSNGSNSGKGFVTYFKDDKVYNMEVIFVNGRKEGRGILRDESGKVVGNYFFYDDKVCGYGVDGKSGGTGGNGKNRNSKLQNSSKYRFSPIEEETTLWNRIVLFIILFVVSYLIYEGLYYVLVSVYVDSNGELAISTCETSRHIISESNTHVGKLTYHLDYACDHSRDDLFLLQKFKACYQLVMLRGNRFTSLNFSKPNIIRILEIDGYNSVEDIQFSDLPYLSSLRIYPNSLSTLTTMDLRNNTKLEELNIEEEALPNLDHLALTFQGKSSSIVIGKKSLQSVTKLSIKSHYAISSIFIKQGALPSLEVFLTDYLEIDYLMIGKDTFHFVEDIFANKCKIAHLVIDSEMKGVFQFKYENNQYTKSIVLGFNALSHTREFSLRHFGVLNKLTISMLSLDNATLFELVDIPELEELVIPSGSLNKVQTFNIQKLNKLKSIVIREYSLQSLMSFMLDGRELPSLWNLNFYEYSLNAVSRLEIANIRYLERLTFKWNSFTESASKRPTMKHQKVASIFNCSSLQSIDVEDYSMSEFTEFNIFNLPHLKTLTIGEYSFYYIDRFILRDLPLLDHVKIGSVYATSVFEVKETIFDNLPSLQSIYLGYNSLFGDDSVSQKGRNILLMQNLPNLTIIKYLSSDKNQHSMKNQHHITFYNIPKLTTEGIVNFFNYFENAVSLNATNADGLKSFICSVRPRIC